jgi:hypothetical protein
MEESKPMRRVLSATIVVPPSMAEHLNTNALAVLVIRDEAKATGKCELLVTQIAERANIAKVRAAIRLAESLGAIAIEEIPDPSGCSSIVASPPAVD